jgi:predicted nucleotidyltransferase
MPVQTRAQLLALLREHETRLGEFGVVRYGPFGSFARESPARDSDVDLLVEFAPGKKTFDNFIQLAFFLEDLLGRPVDLVTPESLSPHVGPHILREVQYVTIGA